MLRFCFKNMSRLKSKKGDSPTLKSLHLKKKLHSQKKKTRRQKETSKNFSRSHQPRLAKLAGVPAQHL